MPIEIEFCKGRRCCPSVKIYEEQVLLGGMEEGTTTWSVSQFRDFISSVKSGAFDDYIS